jgi:hypothetical protein
MDQQLSVHPRVTERHPELTVEDVTTAWTLAIAYTLRTSKDFTEQVAIGFDGKGRLIEMVAARSFTGGWKIFHAMTPPSEKTYKELGIERR